MSTTRDLVEALKAELRRARITYAQLGAEVGLAESTIKRIFARGDMPLTRVDQILRVLKIDFGDLARQIALAQPARRELTLAQERAVVADPKLLLVAICALSQWTLEQIVHDYAIERHQVLACLLELDRLDLLELRPNNSYRLKIDKTFRWRPHGPVMAFFREHVVGDYYSGGFDGPGEMLMLVHGQITPAQAALFNDRLQRLGQEFAQQHQADHRLGAGERQPYTMVIGMRSWMFAAFRDLRRVTR